MSPMIKLCSVAAVIFCVFIVSCAYSSARTYNLQVLVRRRRPFEDPEFQVFGDHYSVYFVLILPALYFMVMQTLRTILAVDVGVASRIALIPTIICAILGWSLGIAVNGNHRLRALQLAEAIYYIDSGGKNGEYEISYRGKEIPEAMSPDHFLTIVDADSEENNRFLQASVKRRKQDYPIILDYNPHTS